MARSAMTTAPRRVTAETPSRVFPSSRDLRYGATSPLHSRGVPREALDARHDPPERGPCQVALKGRRRSRAPAGRPRTTTTITLRRTTVRGASACSSRNRVSRHARSDRRHRPCPGPGLPDRGGDLVEVLRREHDGGRVDPAVRSEEHTSELQSRLHLVCRLLL